MQTTKKSVNLLVVVGLALLLTACGKDEPQVAAAPQTNTSTFDLGKLQNDCEGRRGRVYEFGDEKYCKYPVKVIEDRQCFPSYFDKNSYFLSDFSRITEVRTGEHVSVKSAGNDITFRITIDGTDIDKTREADFIADRDGFLFARNNRFYYYYGSGGYCLQQLTIQRCEDFQGKTYNCRL